MDIANIAVIGSGVAATSTLIELLVKVLGNLGAERKLKITIIEKYSELWKGIPYGSRSSLNSLIITSSFEFISDETDRNSFLKWVVANLKRWTVYYRANGGLAAKKWLALNLPLIEKRQWRHVYLPRFVFGIYLQDKMLILLKQAEKKDLVSFTLLQAEAIDITRENEVYKVLLERPDKKLVTILAKKLLVAPGSAPVRENVKATIQNLSYNYINELYEPFLDENLKTIQKALMNTFDVENRNVLVIGSNASSVELMYLLNHRPDILGVTNKIVTISQTGIMPRNISKLEFEEYPCLKLDNLKAEGNFDIHSLVKAILIDIEPAVEFEVNIPYTDKVISYALDLMQQLDETSKKLFFGVYGPQISRLIRRSGPEYKSSSEELIRISKLELLKGRFLAIENTSTGGALRYSNQHNQIQTYPLSFKVVINCSGSDALQNSSSRLIYNLLRKDICKINLSEKGFVVNDKFEAAPNLYIMGPLLGGNMNKLIHFWHLENVSRLLYLAPFLADELLAED